MSSLCESIRDQTAVLRCSIPFLNYPGVLLCRIQGVIFHAHVRPCHPLRSSTGGYVTLATPVFTHCSE